MLDINIEKKYPQTDETKVSVRGYFFFIEKLSRCKNATAQFFYNYSAGSSFRR